MSAVKEYAAQEVVVYFGGVQVTGFADGDFVEIEQMSPAYDTAVGSDGETVFNKSSDRRVKVTITVLQTSLANAALSTILGNDVASVNGLGIGTCLIQDLNGNSVAKGSKARIMSYPKSVYGNKAGPRAWEIVIADGNRFEGGNVSL